MCRIIDRVNDYIQYKGMSVRAFENEAGIKYSTISAAIKRGTELNTATLLRIINTYDDIDTDWLMRGEGDMIKEESISPNKSLILSQSIKENELELPCTDEFEYINNDNGGKIPVVHELTFATFDPDEPIKINADDYYYIKEFRNADFLYKLSGDYMSPKYRSGDLIACRNVKHDNFYAWGRIYALLTCHQGIIVGRVYEHNNLLIDVKPCNPDYPTWTVPFDEIARIALVIGAISMD